MSNATPVRRQFVDYDARRTPKTARWCCWCQRDLDPAKPHFAAYLDADMHAIHPDDLDARGALDDDYGWHLIGRDCAKKLGIEFTAPQERAAAAQIERESAFVRRKATDPIDVASVLSALIGGHKGTADK